MGDPEHGWPRWDDSEVLWYEDYETGTTMNRPEFRMLCEAVFAGAVKTVVVWRLDRLACSMKEGVNVVSSLCEAGVRVVSITQQIDLSGTVGQMVAGVLFGIAQIEHQHIRERQAAGIALAKEKGVYTGRKPGATKARPERARLDGTDGPPRAISRGNGKPLICKGTPRQKNG